MKKTIISCVLCVSPYEKDEFISRYFFSFSDGTVKFFDLFLCEKKFSPILLTVKEVKELVLKTAQSKIKNCYNSNCSDYPIHARIYFLEKEINLTHRIKNIVFKPQPTNGSS